MAARPVGFSVNRIEDELTKAGIRLSLLTSSIPELIDALAQVKNILSGLDQAPSKSMQKAMRPSTESLIAKELVRHPYLDVNISVACCICEILRIMAPNAPYNDEQLKDFFELVATTLEKLSIASGGCYTKITTVLELFRKTKVFYLMLDLALDEFVVRIFKQFLTVADSNSSDIVLEMEQIMTMIIEEAKLEDELTRELVNLLLTSVRKDNQIASPSCSKLGEKVLNNCAHQLKPRFARIVQEMGLSVHYYSEIVAHICTNPSENETLKRKHDEAILLLKEEHRELIEAIFMKHGDIAAKCAFKTASVRAFFFQIVCKTVNRIQTNDTETSISEREEIEGEMTELEAANIDVSWLRLYLEAVQKRKEAKKRFDLLLGIKESTMLLKGALEMELKERYEEMEAAKQRFLEAKRRVKALEVVEKKVDDDILESKAEEDYRVKPLVQSYLQNKLK